MVLVEPPGAEVGNRLPPRLQLPHELDLDPQNRLHHRDQAPVRVGDAGAGAEEGVPLAFGTVVVAVVAVIVALLVNTSGAELGFVDLVDDPALVVEI